MTTKVEKQAQQDATEYAAAYMAYGEGAGTRRKLIEGTVEYKMQFVPGYREAFEKAHGSQNMAKHAELAKKQSRRKTANEAVTRNTKALVSGKYENVNTSIIIAGAVAYVLHKTGHDKTVIAYSKKQYHAGKDQVKKTTKELRQRFRRCNKPTPEPSNGGGDGKVHRITDV